MNKGLTVTVNGSKEDTTREELPTSYVKKSNAQTPTEYMYKDMLSLRTEKELEELRQHWDQQLCTLKEEEELMTKLLHTARKRKAVAKRGLSLVNSTIEETNQNVSKKLKRKSKEGQLNWKLPKNTSEYGADTTRPLPNTDYWDLDSEISRPQFGYIGDHQVQANQEEQLQNVAEWLTENPWESGGMDTMDQAMSSLTTSTGGYDSTSYYDAWTGTPIEYQ
ncbi:putative Rep1 protein [Circo-like virus Croatia 17_S17]|nr:putative Rep1 protein [Circo-like virus Croatia 17_S17]